MGTQTERTPLSARTFVIGDIHGCLIQFDALLTRLELRWERFDRICKHDSGKIIICGHTPQKSGRPVNRGFAICIDTHACGGGMLTCLDPASGKIWQADVKGKVQIGNLAMF